MEAWAKAQISGHMKHSSVNIWPSAGYAALRRQLCFSEASNYEIKQAVMKHSTKLNFSIVRSDQRKWGTAWGHWPPRSRYQDNELGNHIDRLLGDPRPPIPEEYKRQFYIGFSMYETFSIGSDGLPDREEYFKIVWERGIRRENLAGLPIPPYPWPKLRRRFLSLERLGKAACELPFRCPICHTDEPDRLFHGGWFMDTIDPYFCRSCHRTVLEFRHRVQWEREYKNRIPVPRKISSAAAQRALKELGLLVPRREALRAITDMLSQPEKEKVNA